MKTLFFLMNCCHCGRPANPANWQPVVDAIPCICWGIIMLIALYLILKLIVLPSIKNCHEMKMKEKIYELENGMINNKTNLENKKACTEENLNEMKTKVSDLESKLKHEELNRGLLEQHIKIYCDIFNKLNVEIKPKENK